jgi:hypothetical protein
MHLTTTHKILIVGLFVSAIVGLLNSATIVNWIQNKPLIEISFGNATNYPQQELQSDGTYYYIDLIGINKGKQDTSYQANIVASNAIISFPPNNWASKQSQNLLMPADSKSHTFLFHVSPIQNATSFSVSLVPGLTISQDVIPLNPVQLNYQLVDNKWKLIS